MCISVGIFKCTQLKQRCRHNSGGQETNCIFDLERAWGMETSVGGEMRHALLLAPLPNVSPIVIMCSCFLSLALLLACLLRSASLSVRSIRYRAPRHYFGHYCASKRPPCPLSHARHILQLDLGSASAGDYFFAFSAFRRNNKNDDVAGRQ